MGYSGFVQLSKFKRACEDPAPVYYLIAPPEYLRKKIFETVLQQVDEQARTFDWRAYDLEQDSLEDLLQECGTPPWMSSRRWLFVHNAQLAGKAFVEYLKNPSPRTVLILELKRKPAGWPAHETIEMPRSLDSVAWVVKRAEAEGYRLQRPAAQTLVELVGDDLQLLESQLEKLFLYNLDSREISRQAVLEVSFPGRDYDIFGLINALAKGNGKEALTILGRLSESGMSAPQILSMLHWSFRRLLVAREWLQQRKRFDDIVRKLKIFSYRGRERQVRNMTPERLRRILLRLQYTDRLAKSTPLDERMLIERLVIDTCQGTTL